MCEWWKQGIFFVGGWHPLAARLRRTVNQSVLLESQYDWETGDERLKNLAANHVDLIIAPYDRGLGPSDAVPEQERIREFAVRCRRHGIKLGVYLANSIYFESMLKDYPDCADWAIHNSGGQFANYGGEQTFRWIACFNSPPWRQRMKGIIHRAITEVEADLLHFDNLAVWPEPDSCHCHWCQEKFRAYLSRKYPDAATQKARFGITGFDTFSIPVFYNNFQPAWSFERFANPLIQDFIDFRCQTVTDYINELGGYARSLKRDIVIDANGQSVSGVNKAFLYGCDPERQLAEVEIACDENPDFRPDPAVDAIKPEILSFRGMKQSRQFGKGVFAQFRNASSLAFNLAFGGSPGIYMGWGYAENNINELIPLPGEIQDLLAFFRKYRHYFGVVQCTARVAVWRSSRSLRYISSWTHLSSAVMEQLLFNRKIPFTIVSDNDMDKFDLLIVPDAEYLSDSEEKRIMEMVKNGKSVLITEYTGSYKDNGRKRHIPAFQEMFKLPEFTDEIEKENGIFDPSRQFSPNPAKLNEFPIYVEYGEGRAVYLPEIRYRHQPGEFQSKYNIHYNGIDSRYWKEPGNAVEIIEALEWLYPRLYPVKVTGAPAVYLDTLSHGLVLYRTDGERPVDLRVKIPVPQCRLLLPENDEPLILNGKKSSDFYEMKLPSVRRLALVIYESNEKELF